MNVTRSDRTINTWVFKSTNYNVARQDPWEGRKMGRENHTMGVLWWGEKRRYWWRREREDLWETIKNVNNSLTFKSTILGAISSGWTRLSLMVKRKAVPVKS